MMTKIKIFVNNSQVTFRIHFAGNLCLIIRKIFLISSIFCSSKSCYLFFTAEFLKNHVSLAIFMYFKLLLRMVSGF